MKKTLGIIGIGAFGEFMLKHVLPYFQTSIYDAKRDLTPLAASYNVTIASFDEICQCDIIIIAVPVRAIEAVIEQIKGKLRPGQLVMDVASVKCIPTKILSKHLPDFVDIVSLHPLFGPQSGRYGIHGQNISVIEVRGGRAENVVKFLNDKLDLNVIETTAEHHDLQMAYVQGLTHMIAKVFKKIDMPEIVQQTKTFSLLQDMVNIVKNDSDELFLAIQRDNPYVDGTKEAFFNAVKELEISLHQQK